MRRDTGFDRPTVEELLALRAHVEAVARSEVRDEHAAQDLAQDTWLAALRSPPRHRSNLRGWLGTVARHLARRRSRRPPSLSLDELEESPPAAPEQREDRETYERLVAAIRGLRAPYSEVLSLRFTEGLPPAAIAVRRRTTVNTVNSQLQRGLALLRRELEPTSKSLSVLAAFSALLRPRRASELVARVLLAGALAVAVLAPVLWDWEASPASRDAPSIARFEPAERTRSSPAIRREAVPVPSTPPGAAVRSPDGTAPPIPEVAVVVEAKVTDSATGRPLAGVTVSVVEVGRQDGRGPVRRVAGTTDAAGEVTVEVYPSEIGRAVRLGDVRFGLCVQRGDRLGPWTFVAPPEAPSSGEAPRLAVSLELGSADQSLGGRVVDELGRPIEGALVQGVVDTPDRRRADGAFVGERNRFSRSLPDGSFVLVGLPPGIHELFVIDPRDGTLTRAEGRAGTDGLTVVVGRTGSIAGLVLDARGRPVANAEVEVEVHDLGRTARTGPDGTYRIEGLPAGPSRLRARGGPGDDLRATARVEVRAGEESGWDPTLAPWPPLELHLVDERGEGLAGLHVLLQSNGRAPWRAQGRADESGTVRFPARPPERLRASVSLKGDLLATTVPFVRAFVGPDEGELEVVVPGARTPCSVQGSLAPGPIRAEDARLEFTGSAGRSGSCPVAADGTFRLDGFAPGAYRMVATAEGAGATLVSELELLPGEVFDVGEIALPALSVLELSRRPARGEVMVVRSIYDPTTVIPASGDDGPTWSLLPGRYVVARRVNGELAATHDVVLEANDSLRLELDER